MKNADAKRERIIESAKKRFSHFGMAKTTMAEIAKDLSFSKALLYYYFPDKNSLYAAVLDYIIDELLESTDRIIHSNKSTEDIMMDVLDMRMKYIKDHYNIFEFTYSMSHEMPADLQRILPSAFDKEHQQIKKILQVGIERGDIEVDDQNETAKILLVALIGSRMGVLNDSKNLFMPPTKEEYDQILAMQKKMAKIFIRGLRKD